MPSGAIRSPLILKLHGSTNWITSYMIQGPNGPALMQASDPSTFYVFERSAEPYPAYEGRFVGGFAPYSYGYYPPNIPDDPGRSAPPGRVLVRARYQAPGMEGGGSAEGLVSMPLIIPPVRKKSYQLFGGLFDGLWDAAAEALAQAEAIAIIGYSFPETDTRSRELFGRVLSGRTTTPRVTIVDPTPDRALSVLATALGNAGKNIRCIRQRFEDGYDCQQLFR